MQIGKGSLNELPEILRIIGPIKSVLIVTDKQMVEFGYVKKLQGILSNSGLKSNIFDETIPDPTDTVVLNGIDFLEKNKNDAVIGFGGGSPIDTAKAIAVLSQHSKKIQDYKPPSTFDKKGLPIIAIPTTAGTGSEVTHHSVIIDTKSNNNEKISCRGEGFVPVVSIIDFELTLSKPRRLTIDSAIDTLTHGIEAYVSKKATLFSDRMALDTIRLVQQNIYEVDENPKNVKAREGLMLAATLGGLAFSNASICLVHGMSRPLGSNFKVPHGLSNAMLLPTITEFSIDHAKNRYADCSRAGNFANIEDNDDVACQKLIKGLYKINKDFDVPSMQEFGINEKKFEEELENMATDAKISGAPNLNPKVPTINEMIDLYRKAWRAF
ncbi:iron-containing alcohol dehydrogenase [Candidatus Pelagibacter sp. HIMB1709]|uniref:iron-containing alcohol dehydrogenase n=1 Tax=Candidatus Pelagibacter sp. HIMB1709 TaxID=3413367 RepID=UPI003F832946